MRPFYSRLSYSLGNEDWRTEQKALNIQSKDTVLCITASGDRPLNLLSSDCKAIVAIDANPMQTALCELKKAALLELDYESYLAYLGLTPCNHRLSLQTKIEKRLSGDYADLWARHFKKIQKGILYQGTVEKLLRFASTFIDKFAGHQTNLLFNSSSLEEQRHMLATRWKTQRWQRAFRLIINPLFTSLILRDPGLYLNLGIKETVAQYIYRRLEESLYSFPIKENIIVSLIFKGKLFKEAFSPHLCQQMTPIIRERLDRLRCHTINVIDYLENIEPESFDCFSLSDVASYMNKSEFNRLCRALVRAAKPKARFCMRQLMSTHQIPDELASHFHRDAPLEAHLQMEDRCFVYRFMVGTILK